MRMGAPNVPRTVMLFLAGDVMTGRGIDQILPQPADPQIYESYVTSATEYVRIAERKSGPIPRPVSFEYVWGDGLAELEHRRPDARIINLETAVTNSMRPEPKGINYKMNPENVGVLCAAGIDCCILANNHMLDWGRAGLIETLETLDQAGVRHAGAGLDGASAAAPAIVGIGDHPVVVYAFASIDSGVGPQWAAGPRRPGVNFIPRLSAKVAEEITERLRTDERPRLHPLVVSIHWGANWGYEVPEEHAEFAHRLIDSGLVDIVHGHSSHHVKGFEVYRGKLILYGCGDLINDYEGITGEEAYRGDLALMYFPTISAEDGTLARLELVPMHLSKMRLNRAGRADADFLAQVLNREGRRLGTRVALGPDNVLRLLS